jgi:RHS repeat-associated protein
VRRGSTYHLTYDAENRLTGVNGAASATFVYDGDGNRVKATFGSVTTVYVGNYYEKEGSTVRTYYYAGGARVAMREGSTLYYILTDHLGSTAITANSDGTAKVGELRYFPHGKTRYTDGTTPTNRRFTGQVEDATIGLYFYNARYYDPALGRFVQADTIVPEPGNPQALNRYAYTVNNPLKYIDPSGHCWGPFDFVRGIPSYGTTCNNLDMALTIAKSPGASPGQRAGAVGYIALEGTAHAALATGTGILAWEGATAAAAALGGTEAAATAGTAATAACADGDCTNEASTIGNVVSNALQGIRNGVSQGFSSFSSFKYHMGGAGQENAWHHIVGQTKENIARFGAQAIHNVNNLIRLPDTAGSIHRQVTGFYNSIQPLITGSDTLRVYEWLNTKSFEFQYQFGVDTITQFGGEQYIIEQMAGG